MHGHHHHHHRPHMETPVVPVTSKRRPAKRKSHADRFIGLGVWACIAVVVAFWITHTPLCAC